MPHMLAAILLNYPICARAKSLYISTRSIGGSGGFIGVNINYSSNNRIYSNYGSLMNSLFLLNYSTGNSIYQNTIENSGDAIWLIESSNNMISQNIIGPLENSSEGIKLENSSFNIISGNDISAWLTSIDLSGNNNTFVDNTVSYNYYSVLFRRSFGSNSNNNMFYHNNFLKISGLEDFIKVAAQEQKDISMNFFDNGYPTGENYWNDRLEADQFNGVNQDQLGSDGIFDSPVLYRGGIFDNYAFVEADGWLSSSQTVVSVGGGQDNVAMQSNAEISDVVATKNSIHCTVSGPSGSKAFVSIATPTSANTTELKVFVNNTKLTPPPFPIISTNGTHYIVYFELSLSTHNIEIEYASSNWFDQFIESLPYIGLAIGISAIISVVVLYIRKKSNQNRMTV